MKRILLLLLIVLLWYSVAYSGNVASWSGVADSAVSTLNGVASGSIATCDGQTWNDGDGVADFCSGTCTDTDADYLCEDWGATPECTWTDIDAGSGTSDTNNTRTAGIFCTDNGDTVDIQIVDTDSSNYGGVRWDRGSTADNWYVTGYFYVNSESLGSGTEVALVRMTSSTTVGDHTVGIGYRNAAGTKVARHYYYDGAVKTANVGVLAAGTWYYFRLMFQSGVGAGGSQIDIDYNGDGDFGDANESTAYTSGTRAARYVLIGGVAAGGALTFEVENLKVDDTAFAADCTR